MDVLQDIVDSYNVTPHRSLNKIAPKEVNKDNEADIWAFMYLKPKKNKTENEKQGDTEISFQSRWYG